MSTQQTVYSKDIEAITVYWINNTDDEYVFGQPFQLEQLVDGAWEKIPLESGYAFTLEGIPVSARSQTEHVYDLIGYSLPLTSGKYRIAITYLSDYGPGDYIEHSLYAEFVIT